MDDGNRIFARYGKGLYFNSENSQSVVVKGNKGIPLSKDRTVSFWIYTQDHNATLIDWGADEPGQAWQIELRNGKLSLGFGGGVNLTTVPLINDSAWHHVVVSLPTGSTYADETIVYLDGNPVLFEESVAFSPEEYSTSLWLDSSDLTSISHSSDSIHEWRDKSGNDFHAIQSTLTKKPTLILSGLDEKPVVNFDGTDDSISSTSLNISQSYSIFIVAKTNNNETGRDYIFDGAISSARSLVALDESGKIKMWAGWDNGGWQDSTFSTPDGYFVMTAVFDTTNGLLGLNGTSTSV